MFTQTTEHPCVVDHLKRYHFYFGRCINLALYRVSWFAMKQEVKILRHKFILYFKSNVYEIFTQTTEHACVVDHLKGIISILALCRVSWYVMKQEVKIL